MGGTKLSEAGQVGVNPSPSAFGPRPGWAYEEMSDGSYVGWPSDNVPTVVPNHIDGPLVRFRNGELHWLTWWERIMFAVGLLNALTLERKYRPHLAEIAGRAALSQQNNGKEG